VKRENGRYWVHDEAKIMTFIRSASDNAPQLLAPTIIQIPSIEPTAQIAYHSPTVAYRSLGAQWSDGTLILRGSVERLDIGGGTVSRSAMDNTEVPFAKDPMFGISEKPSHLNRTELRSRMDESESDTEKRMYSVALEKRYTTPFLPLIIALVAAPFGLSLARRGRVLAVGGAIGMWLLFVGATSVFEQFGQNGMLSVELAVWAPLAIFAAIGVYLLSRLRT